MHHPLSENDAFSDDDVLYPRQEQTVFTSVFRPVHQDEVWICYHRLGHVDTKRLLELYSDFLLASTTASLEASERSLTPLPYRPRSQTAAVSLFQPKFTYTVTAPIGYEISFVQSYSPFDK